MDPEKLMTELSSQLSATLKAMAKAKTVEEKKQYSEILKNLSESLGVFLGIIRDLAPYDFDEDDDNIRIDHNGRYRIKAQTAIEDFNAALGTNFSDEECHTVGGLILNHLGRVPNGNETIVLDGVRFLVLRADSRRLYTLYATRLEDAGKPD